MPVLQSQLKSALSRYRFESKLALAIKSGPSAVVPRVLVDWFVRGILSTIVGCDECLVQVCIDASPVESIAPKIPNCFSYLFDGPQD